MRVPAVLVMIMVTAGLARGDAWTVPAGIWRFSPSFAFYSAQRQYNAAGMMTHLYYDGTYDFLAITLYAETGITDDLTLIADLPVGHSIFEARDSAHTYTRTLTQPSYYGLGARYALWHPGASVLSFSGALHVPPGLHHGLFDDPRYSFLSDGFLEGVAALEFGTRARWGWFEGVVAFHARGEEAANQMEYRAVVGFASQQRVKIKITMQAVHSLTTLPEAPLDVEQTITAEDYLWIDGQVLFSMTDRVALGASIGVRAIGAHTLSLSGGTVSVLF